MSNGLSRTRLVGNLVLLVTSLVLSVVLVEGGLRVFPDLLPAAIWNHLRSHRQGVRHPYIGHLHTPNDALVIPNPDFDAVHHTDAHGFRNAWPWPEDVEIVAIGDSLTFGYGVEDDQTWPALINRDLPRLGLVNLGLIGASPEQYARVYETFGVPLQPKLLLVGLFLGNDFWDAAMFDRWLQSGAEGNYMVWRNAGGIEGAGFSLQRPVASTKTILRRHSVLYNLLHHARNVYRDWQRDEPKRLRLADGASLELRPSDLASSVEMSAPDRLEFQRVLQALKRIQSIAKAQGTRVLVIMQPNKEQVYLPLLGASAPDPGRHLRAALDRAGIAYLDITPAFQQQARAGRRLFFTSDSHPNRQGYRLIAREVLAHLKRNAHAFGLTGTAMGASPLGS